MPSFGGASGATALQLPLIEMCDVLPDWAHEKNPADLGPSGLKYYDDDRRYRMTISETHKTKL